MIRDGQPWTAFDELGSGIDAVIRMMIANDLAFECSPPAAAVEPRSLAGSCEHLLFEAARIIDECRAGSIPTRTRTERVLASVTADRLPHHNAPRSRSSHGSTTRGSMRC